MTRPEDIPADVWDSYAEVAKTWPISDMTLTELLARALMPYGPRRAAEATERAAQVAVGVFNQATVSIRDENSPEQQGFDTFLEKGEG